MTQQLEIHSGPDDLNRYSYTLRWATANPPYCSECGANVTFADDGYISCTRCDAAGYTMPRGQVFFAVLPEQHNPEPKPGGVWWAETHH